MATLKTRLWVQALIRRVQLEGSFVALLKRGDEEAGDVIVKVNNLAGDCFAYQAVTGFEGEKRFMDLRLQGLEALEKDIDAYCHKRMANDPDLWVVEIEDSQGRHFLTEPVDVPEV